LLPLFPRLLGCPSLEIGIHFSVSLFCDRCYGRTTPPARSSSPFDVPKLLHRHFFFPAPLSHPVQLPPLSCHKAGSSPFFSLVQGRRAPFARIPRLRFFGDEPSKCTVLTCLLFPSVRSPLLPWCFPTTFSGQKSLQLSPSDARLTLPQS